MCVGKIKIYKGNCIMNVDLDHVVLIERRLRKICIVTDKEEHEYYERLENIIPCLDQRFYPCLQGCYINFEKVSMMKDQEIRFKNEYSFYLGKTNFQKTRRAYKKYLENS